MLFLFTIYIWTHLEAQWEAKSLLTYVVNINNHFSEFLFLSSRCNVFLFYFLFYVDTSNIALFAFIVIWTNYIEYIILHNGSTFHIIILLP